MTKHLVSIIIPVYNVSDYVEECLQSVAAQTYTDIECIIVDDCGTDDSMQKVERFVADYQGPIAFKILHHEHNRGLSAARNTGMDAATGEYIYFIDSDDYIYPHSIAVLVKAIEQEPDIDIAEAYYNSTLPTSFNIKDGIYNNRLFLRSQWKIQIAVWNQLYKRSFLSNHGLRFAEGLLHEDHLWSFQVACYMPKFVILNKTTYYYRDRDGSITHSCFTSRVQHYCRVYEEMIRFIFSHNLNHLIDAFNCINRHFKHDYILFLWNGNKKLTYTYYQAVRHSPYWNFFKIWSFTHSWKHIIMHFHRYMPERFGFKFFQYVFAKCFDHK